MGKTFVIEKRDQRIEELIFEALPNVGKNRYM